MFFSYVFFDLFHLAWAPLSIHKKTDLVTTLNEPSTRIVTFALFYVCNLVSVHPLINSKLFGSHRGVIIVHLGTSNFS